MEHGQLEVEPQALKVEQHMRRVENGIYRLPEFQRTFVWNDEQIRNLWDSLYRGFPIGQIMLWEPDNADFPMRALGRGQTEVEATRQTVAVIDGQQRLTALQVVLSGDTPLRFDLSNTQFSYADRQDCLRLDILRQPNGQTVPFEQAANEQYFYRHATEAQRTTFAAAINRLNTLLTQREVPSQKIRFANYATVLGVFKRLNEAGTRLNQAQLTMAGISQHWPGVFRRTYDLLKCMNVEMGFDRAEDPTFVFQVWAAVHTKQHLIPHLAPEDERSPYWPLVKRDLYETSWTLTEYGISQLTEMMRQELDLTNFRFITVSYPLAVVAHYMATHPTVSSTERDMLRRWLVMSLVSGRYHERTFSRYGRDIKATTQGREITSLFQHRDALDPFSAEPMLLNSERVSKAHFRSAYQTLLYLVARRLQATDWLEMDVRVGEPLTDGTWQFHHIFPNESFDGERGRLRIAKEEAESNGDEAESRRIEGEKEQLDAKVWSIGNLAFLLPATNQSISNRLPSDYLKEIAASSGGKKTLEAQLIPLNPELWKHSAFDAFCRERCDLLVAKAKELFFPC